MKINKIYLKNINSFKGEHRINFTENPLMSAGLFAIVGPTGAGKSTLLDAITLALFNQIPRFDKKISKDFVASAGSILTKGERECAVEIEFSCKSGIFISKWWIEINKNQNFNDYGMEILDLQTQLLLPLKKGEIPKKNEDLIGLTYDQFVKSILLSQGEFAKFLKSGKDERGKLLEDITGTQIYRKLGKKAFEIAKEKGHSLRDLRANIDNETKKLSDEITEQSWYKRKNEIDDHLQKINAKLKDLETKINQNTKLAELQKQIDQKNISLKQAQSDLVAFEENEAIKLQIHEKAIPFQTVILELKNQNNELKNLQTRKEDEEKALQKCHFSLTQTIQRIGLLSQNNAVNEENALPFLQEFRQNLSQLQQQKSEQEGIKKANEKQIQDLVESITDQSLTFEINNLSEQTLEHIKQIGIDSKNQIAETLKIAKIDKSEDANQKREELVKEYRYFTQLREQIIDFSRLTKEQNTEKQQIETQQKNFEQYKPELEKAQKQLAETEQQLKNLTLEKDRLGKAYNFEKDRQQLLKKNEPCPLCGSLEHPFLTHYANNYVEIDLLLNNTREKQTQLHHTISGLKSNIETAHTFTKTAQEKLQEISSEIQLVSEKIKLIKGLLKIDKVGNKEAIEEQILALEQQQDALNIVIEKHEKIKNLQNLYKLCQRTQQIQQIYHELCAKIKQQYAGENFEKEYNECQTNFTSFQTQTKNLTLVLENLTKEILPIKLAFDAKLQETKQQVILVGFTDLNHCAASILPLDSIGFLQQKKQNLQVDIQKFIAQLKDHKEEFEAVKLQISTENDLSQLMAMQSEFLQNQKLLNEENTKIEVNLAMQNKTKQIIADLQKILKKTEKDNLKWELLDKYIGDSTGKKFSTFAQGLTLSRLIVLANRRLTDLSDRYLLDKPAEEEEDELMIVDLYMGNERRSIKTLSGGETFMISLSLALALSDLASKNIKLDSLFIDEGFGTLDPETLELALDTLERLQQEAQKNIGIISHVESIKERITCQIRLERNSRGFSQIKIQ